MRRRSGLCRSVIAALAVASAAIAVVGSPPSTGAAATNGDECVVVGNETYSSGVRDRSSVRTVSGAALTTVPYAQAISATTGRVAWAEFSETVSSSTQIMTSAIDGSDRRVVIDYGVDPDDHDWTSELVFSPTGEHLAWLEDDPTGKDPWLKVADVDGTSVLDTFPIEVRPDGFDFSPDGTQIAYIEANGVFDGYDIWVAPTDGSAPPTKIVDHVQSDASLPPYFPPKSVRNIEWSPDGTQLAISGRDGISSALKTAAWPEIYVLDADGSNLREVAVEPGEQEAAKSTPVWSPDGKRLVYTHAYNQDSRLAIVDLATDAVTYIAGTQGYSIDAQGADVEWSAATDHIVFQGFDQQAPLGSPGQFGVLTVPAGGGTVTNIWETDSQEPFDGPFIGLVPCDIAPPPSFNGEVPERILDTREGLGAPLAPLGPQGSIDLDVLGAGPVPSSGVEAVALNVTVTNTTAPSFLTVYPAGVDRPFASNLNWDRGGTTRPNLVVVTVGDGGAVSLYNQFGSADVIADVVGWFGDGPGYVGITPTRLLDTRENLGGAGPVTDRQTVSLQVHGSTVPTSATGVIMNTTAAEIVGAGYVTVYPDGAPEPFASNLNTLQGNTSANLVVTGIRDSGRVNFLNRTPSAQLIADATGYFESGSGYTGMTPVRLLDTRIGASFGPEESRAIPIAGVERGVPASARVAIVNLTAVAPTQAGFLTVYPSGTDRPVASNVNFLPGDVIPNLVFATIGTDGSIVVYNSHGETDVLIDVVGYFS